jgi:hypothetical protein
VTYLRNASWWISLDSLFQYSTNFVVPQTPCGPLRQNLWILVQNKWRSRCSDYVAKWTTSESRFDSWQGSSFFSRASSELGAIQLLIQSEKGTFYPRIKRPKRKADKFLLVLRLTKYVELHLSCRTYLYGVHGDSLNFLGGAASLGAL